MMEVYPLLGGEQDNRTPQKSPAKDKEFKHLLLHDDYCGSSFAPTNPIHYSRET